MRLKLICKGGTCARWMVRGERLVIRLILHKNYYGRYSWNYGPENNCPDMVIYLNDRPFSLVRSVNYSVMKCLMSAVGLTSYSSTI